MTRTETPLRRTSAESPRVAVPTAGRLARTGIPRLALLCALIASLNAAAWSLITPPFQVPDEPSHVAYVRQLAETARLPTHHGAFSLEELYTLEGLHQPEVTEQPEFQPISTHSQQEQLELYLQRGAAVSQPGSESAGVATSEPPLYYALEAIPYNIARSGTLLDRLELMRLLSALMGGLTALFTFLFIRESLPRYPWSWTVGALSVALMPLLGFMSGAVNPDALLFAVSAALFYALARGFRRGLTRRQAVAIGALIAVGFATKLNFVGLAPGALLGLVALSIRAAGELGARAYRSLVIALAIALAPPAAYIAAHVSAGAPALGIVSSAVGGAHGSLWRELSYVWQLYLPRLPGMHNDFSGLQTTRGLWFRGYVGIYGWFDTLFPKWVYEIALLPAMAIAGLCARSLIVGATALRARALELAVYVIMSLGLMGLIGGDSYLSYPEKTAEYAQVRYLFPLLPLLGAMLALAARGGGRRWGPAVGAAVVMLFLAHDVASQLQEVARYYG